MSQPPLPALPGYWKRSEDRQHAVNMLFDRSAAQYDWICNVTSFGTGQAYRREALVRAGLRRGMTVLDVGTGTGLVAREAVRLLQADGRVIGVDPSTRMMAAGRASLAIPLVQGVGERLPFSDGRFDFLTMGYALRHVPDLDQTFSECRRVLRPGGRVLLLEITRPASRAGLRLAGWYFGGVVPLVARLGTGSPDAARLMRFYWDTIVHCVAPETVLGSLRSAGFSAVERTVTHGMLSSYTATRGAA